MNITKVTVTFKRHQLWDTSQDVSHLEDTAGNYEGCTPEEIAQYVAQDQARLKAHNDDEWHMIGIRAVATIWIEREGYRTQYTIKSPGVWGIESDSDESYLQSVFDEECHTLKADIEAMKQAEFKS